MDVASVNEAKRLQNNVLPESNGTSISCLVAVPVDRLSSYLSERNHAGFFGSAGQNLFATLQDVEHKENTIVGKSPVSPISGSEATTWQFVVG
jgi:hypothetical protein